MSAPAPETRPLPALGAVVLLLAGLAAGAHAGAATWLCDDAFISFRYAENLAQGNGLVFNPGEHVEGYTNFLWTVLLAWGILGLAPEALSTTLGLLAFAGTTLVLAAAGRRTAGAGDRAWVPAAALCWLGLGHARLFATSGLETSLFTLLFTAGAVLAIQAERPRHWVSLGLVAALATLTRPEGGLLLLATAAVAGTSGPGPVTGAPPRPRPGGGPPRAVGGVEAELPRRPAPQHVARQGRRRRQLDTRGRYVDLYLRTWPLVGAGAVALVGLLLRRDAEPGGACSPAGGAAAPLVLLGLAMAFSLHVLQVGGDFMFARFCLPGRPLLLGVEMAVQRVPDPPGGPPWAGSWPWSWWPRPSPGLDAVTGAPWHGITEQRAWYPDQWIAEAARQGAVLQEKTAGLDYSAAYYGTQAMLMYYGRVPHALEAHVGLTDRELARMPPPPGAAVGHGIKATLSYLQERGVDLTFDYRLQQQLTPLNRVEFGQGVTARLLVYRPELADALRARGVQIVDLPAFLDAYIQAMPTFADAKVARDYAGLEAFYFRHADDPARQAAFQQRIGRATPAP